MSRAFSWCKTIRWRAEAYGSGDPQSALQGKYRNPAMAHMRRRMTIRGSPEIIGFWLFVWIDSMARLSRACKGRAWPHGMEVAI